jgi:hypothetical protein
MVLSWTSESLAETVWALNRLLKLVRETGPIVLSPKTSAYRDQVEQWLRQVEPVLDEQGVHEPPESVPPFPLSSSQLESLEDEIQRVLAQRAARERGRQRARATENWRLAISLSASLEHLHKTLHRADRSSYSIIEAVAGLFILDAACLIVVIALRLNSVPTTNFVLAALAGNMVFLVVIGALWRWHHSHLEQHREVLQWHGIHHGLAPDVG